jgi:hypothetical protein
MARIAALSGAGSFAHAVTTWDKSCPKMTGICESLCESPHDSLVKYGGERGIRTPQFPADNKGNPHDDAQIDSQFPVASSPELSQVVTAWTKLPVALKAAILAIVKSAE